jgi:hypothetical protein
VALRLLKRLYPNTHVGTALAQAEDLDSAPALPQNVAAAIWHAQNAADDYLDSDRVEILQVGFLDFGISLSYNDQEVVRGDGCLHCLDGPVSPDRQRGHHMGKDHRIPKGQERVIPRMIAFTLIEEIVNIE